MQVKTKRVGRKNIEDKVNEKFKTIFYRSK
jgi:hypothetical protein